MKKLMSFIGLLLPFVVQAAPVDGYKDLKFGMTLEQVKDSPLCESKWIYVKDINTWGALGLNSEMFMSLVAPCLLILNWLELH